MGGCCLWRYKLGRKSVGALCAERIFTRAGSHYLLATPAENITVSQNRSRHAIRLAHISSARIRTNKNANVPFINTYHLNLRHPANNLPMRFFIISLILAIHASPIFAQGVISDPGFESGTFIPGAAGGWDSLSGSPAF